MDGKRRGDVNYENGNERIVGSLAREDVPRSLGYTGLSMQVAGSRRTCQQNRDQACSGYAGQQERGEKAGAGGTVAGDRDSQCLI